MQQLLQKNTTTNNTSKNTSKKMHFLPLIPKKDVNNNISSSNSGNSFNSHKRKKLNDSSLVVKTSKRWILPPRPRPGRKSCPSNNQSNSTTNHNSINSINSNIHNNNSNSNSNSNSDGNNNKHNNNRTKSLTPLSSADAVASVLPATNDNYLAFLKFDDDNTNIPKNNSNKNANASPLDLSPSSTIVSTPVNTTATVVNNRRFSEPIKRLHVNENKSFLDIYDEMQILESSTSTGSSTAKQQQDEHQNQQYLNLNDLVTDNNENELFQNNENNDDEIYNNIWKLLPRYNNTKENNKKNSANASLFEDKHDKNYSYVAPSLEELMEEQDNVTNFFDDYNSNFFSINDLNDNDNDNKLNDFDILS